jgi:hypothetical protein
VQVPAHLAEVTPPRGYVLVTDRQRTYWSPQAPGEVVEGFLAQRIMDKAPDGKDRERWQLETSDGRQIILPDHYDLMQRLEGLDVGARVWICYRGRERVRGVPSPMARYAVAVWRPES